MGKEMGDAHVIKLGGSLIVPNGGIDIEYVKKFNTFIRRQVLEKNRSSLIFTGVGGVPDIERKGGTKLTGTKLPKEVMDWSAVMATRFMGNFSRRIFVIWRIP